MQEKLKKLKEKLQEEEEKKRKEAMMKEQRFKERKNQIDHNIALK